MDEAYRTNPRIFPAKELADRIEPIVPIPARVLRHHNQIMFDLQQNRG